MKKLLPDRPARHRFAAGLFRLSAAALLLSAAREFPFGAADTVRTAIAYLFCCVLAILLCLVAVLHDLVAAKLPAEFRYRTVRVGDRQITERSFR